MHEDMEEGLSGCANPVALTFEKTDQCMVNFLWRLILHPVAGAGNPTDLNMGHYLCNPSSNSIPRAGSSSPHITSVSALIGSGCENLRTLAIVRFAR